MPYFQPNIEKTKEELQFTLQSKICRVPIRQLKDEETVLRILPPWNERGKIFKVLPLHWVGEKTKHLSICRRILNQSCYLCIKAQELFAKGKENEANKVRISLRAFCNAIVRGEEDKGVQIVSLPATKVAQKLIEVHFHKIGDFTHPQNGYDIMIVRKTEGRFPDYEILTQSPKPLENMGWLEQLYNLDDFENLWIVPSFEEQKEIWAMYGLVYEALIEEPTEQLEEKINDLKDEDIPF